MAISEKIVIIADSLIAKDINDSACQPMATTGNLMPVLSTICLMILITTGMKA
ncbi:hypothetical protein FHX77_000041 [Bifidobacterium commune]|uniref:hypothetical protein n=1 Tax=Bifidobacterium commune TaxID=1505727 RepID=UPI0013563FE8|nr:hypothetical protein [Bifidobacterium commune]MBB2954661.1 hypothetical protein [Bifidobacterium commune]